MSQSEIARILQQIDQEYRASKNALEGFASGAARHDFIQSKTETISKQYEHLATLVGADQAIILVANAIWTPADQHAPLA